MNKSSPYIATIIITEDPGGNTRGYSLLGREFRLKYPHAVTSEAVYADGTKVHADYYIIDLQEYVRVVPEARNSNDNFTKEISIPTMYAQMSFKPSYVG